MAIHELGTNAGKYGALSTSDGQVEIEWDVDAAPSGLEQFKMSWRESGGPAVMAPKRRGFGSKVIRDMVELSFNGQVDIDFVPEGLAWRMTCPADALRKGTILPPDA